MPLSAQRVNPMSYFNTHNKDLFSGVLHKCGAKVKSWNKRWMVLRSDYCLYYYKDATKKSLGSITLRDKCFKTRKGETGDCAWPKNVNMEHTIVMVTSSRTYYMFAESAEEAEEWKQVLQKTHDQLREEVYRKNPLLSEGVSSKRSSTLSESSSSSSVQFGDKVVSNTQVELSPKRDKASMARDYERAYSKDELEKIRFSLGESLPSQNGISSSNGSGGGEVVGEQVDAIYDLAKPEETSPPADNYEEMSISYRNMPTDTYEDMSGTDSRVRSPSPLETDAYELITVHSVHSMDMREGLMSTSARDLPLPPLPAVKDDSTKLGTGLPLYDDVPENTLTQIQQPLYEDVCMDTDTRIGDMRESMQEAEGSGDEKENTSSPPPPLPPKDTPPKSAKDTTVNVPAKDESPVLSRKEIKPTPPSETNVTPPSPHRGTNVTPPSSHRQMNLTLPIDKTNGSPPMPSKGTSISPPSPRKRKNVTPPSPRRKNVTPPPPDREAIVTPPSPSRRKNVTPPSPRRTNVTPPPPDRETIVTPPSPCRRRIVTPPSPRRTNIASPATENTSHLEKSLAPPIPHRETRPTTPPSPRIWTPPPSNLSPSPIPKPRSRSNTSTHPSHPGGRTRSPDETFRFPPAPTKEPPPKEAVISGAREPSELASLPPKLTLKEIVSRGPEDEAIYDEVLFEEEAAVSESSKKERRSTLEKGMALFLKCQERVKNSEDDHSKRTESIRVMESNDPSLSAEDKRLFVETLREVENERIRASEERFCWERERMKLEEERKAFEQEKRKLREELEKTRQQIQDT